MTRNPVVTDDYQLRRKRLAKVLAITRMYWWGLVECLVEFGTEGNSLDAVDGASTANVPHEEVKQEEAGGPHGGQ